MSKIFQGKVIAVNNNKNTIIVKVTTLHLNRIYKKKTRQDKNFKVDYTGSDVKVGDTVDFLETRPISKDKMYKLDKIVTK